VTVKKRR